MFAAHRFGTDQVWRCMASGSLRGLLLLLWWARSGGLWEPEKEFHGDWGQFSREIWALCVFFNVGSYDVFDCFGCWCSASMVQRKHRETH